MKTYTFLAFGEMLSESFPSLMSTINELSRTNINLKNTFASLAKLLFKVLYMKQFKILFIRTYLINPFYNSFLGEKKYFTNLFNG